MVQLWRKDLAKINPKAAESLADPAQYANLFPNMEWALRAEALQAERGTSRPPASAFLQLQDRSLADLIEEAKGEGGRGRFLCATLLKVSGVKAPVWQNRSQSNCPQGVGRGSGNACRVAVRGLWSQQVHRDACHCEGSAGEAAFTSA